MAAAYCAAYVVVLLGVGSALAMLIIRDDRRSIFEFAGLAMTLGVGGLSLLLLLISLCALRPDRVVITSIGMVALGSVALIAIRRTASPPVLPTLSHQSIGALLQLIIPLLVLSGGLFICSIVAVRFPIFDWDAIAIWGFKAKVLYLSPLYPRPWYFDEVRYSATHLDYPLLMPMSLAGAYGMMREKNETLGRIVFPTMLAGQILVLYSGTRLLIARAPALFVTAAAACTPFSIYQSGLGGADLHLATLITGAIVYLLRWSLFHRRADAILAGLFALFVSLTKSEGLPLAFIVALLFLLTYLFSPAGKAVRIHIVLFGSILLVGVGGWLVWRYSIPHIDENYSARMRLSVVLAGRSRALPILKQFIAHMSSIRNFGALWFLVPLLALLGHRAFRFRPARLLWAMLLLQFGLYWSAYLSTPWDVEELIGVTMDRLLIHIAPTAGLIIAVHWSAVAYRSEKVPTHL